MTLYWAYKENKGCNQNFLNHIRIRRITISMPWWEIHYIYIYCYNWAKGQVERLKQIIRESESKYKNLIERIKTL